MLAKNAEPGMTHELVPGDPQTLVICVMSSFHPSDYPKHRPRGRFGEPVRKGTEPGSEARSCRQRFEVFYLVRPAARGRLVL